MQDDRLAAGGGALEDEVGPRGVAHPPVGLDAVAGRERRHRHAGLRGEPPPPLAVDADDAAAAVLGVKSSALAWK